MTPDIVSIGLGQLAVGLVFILAAGVASLLHALKLERDLLVVYLVRKRCFGQGERLLLQPQDH